MKKKTTFKVIVAIIFIVLGVLFVARFAGPEVLRAYIRSGIGDCEQIPILCRAPDGNVIRGSINKEYYDQLRPFRFAKMEIFAPKNFNVIQEKIKRLSYKKHPRWQKSASIYILHENKDYFINLFPQLRKAGINNDQVYIERLMNAKLPEVNNLVDAFFVIMKGIFTPDVGNQKTVLMKRFVIEDKRGFINYNIGPVNNYFDCNFFDDNGAYFKVYIKDIGAKLDLEKVLTIVSSVREAD
ncbi:MAG: hypothetical protein PHO70_00750 [Candidatus Omnitrophica bacterium]|nr:hypothetical protein [Candidatus Omnitrophota bacterium]